MAERRMGEVVGQRQRFGEVFVEPEHPGQGAGNLGHLKRMRQPGAVMIAFVEYEDLGLVFEPPKRRSVNDTVAVAAERAAVLARWLGMQPAAALRRVAGIGCEVISVV